MGARRPLRAAALVGLVALAAAVIARPPAVHPHAALARASPTPRAALDRSPRRVELVFTERLEPAYSRLSVWSDGGQQVDLTDVALEPGEARRLSVSLPPLPPGTYTVRYRVLSVDGHVVEAGFTFRVDTLAPR